MHPNPIFHTEKPERNLAFARDRGFGVLAVNGADGPLMAHIPFLLNEAGTQAGLHLVRSNPIVRALKKGDVPARLEVSGPDSYISPDWYEVPDQVPTWNYVAVAITGTLSLRPEAELEALIAAQSAAFEARLAPKAPWTMDKMSAEAKARLMRQIVPCRLQVTGVAGTWKLNQNKPDAVRLRAADQVASSGQGHALSMLAALMRGA